jgi:hypothetical protein
MLVASDEAFTASISKCIIVSVDSFLREPDVCIFCAACTV